MSKVGIHEIFASIKICEAFWNVLEKLNFEPTNQSGYKATLYFSQEVFQPMFLKKWSNMISHQIGVD